MNAKPSYFNYWGKAKPHNDHGEPYHLLVYHCLDVAAVASVWWDQSKSLQNSFMKYAKGLSAQQMKAWVIFFIALHDYGKFDIRFQRKLVLAWDALQKALFPSLTLPSPNDCRTYDHGSAGLYWFDRDRSPESVEPSMPDDALWLIIDESDEDKGDSAWLAWIKVVTGHHGFVYPNDQSLPDRHLGSFVSKQIAEQDKAARLAWLDALEQLFLQPAGLSLEDLPPIPSPLLAGFCSVADWLGSRSSETHFVYKAESINNLRDYFEQKCAEDAAQVLALSGINGVPKPFSGVEALLNKNYQPRQLQTLVNDLPVTPGLAIVEAPTGSGKTEMALAYAWHLLAENHADSIIFAMPTQATANAMLLRLETLATTLFEDKPNLVLAHGHARFNHEFLALKAAGNTAQGRDEAWAQCNEWLAQSRKRIFLGQVGICTIDQVLVSVLPVKHRFVRGFGVGRSVLIVDEVHAYDAYMYGLLEAVLQAQYQAGGSSLLLSATLNKTLRNTLMATYGKAAIADKLIDSAFSYPLISWVGANETMRSFTLPNHQQPPERHVQIECYFNDDLLPDTGLLQRMIEAAEQGAQVALICNLVDVAQQLARTLKEKTTCAVDVFHARYCLHDRQQKETAVLKHYGTGGKRATGRILVATQVIEQSLDVDFDWLITQLCPVDLLFQRMGRLHRHDRPRPAGLTAPLCTVLLPTGTDYGTHGLIYGNTRVMWRTAQKLQSCPDHILVFPQAYRDWIESVYDDTAWGTEPDEVEAGFETFQDDLLEKRSLAKQMLKWAEDVALNDTDEKIQAVTRDGEFNLTVVPYLETSQGKQLLDGCVLDTLTEWQQAEVLAMNTVGVPRSWRKFLPDADPEQRIWLAMQLEGEAWQAQGNGTLFIYHPFWGMEKSA